VNHAAGAGLAPLIFSWWTMMSVTMLPVTWPWLSALQRLVDPRRSRSFTSALLLTFVAGYLGVWLGFSTAAAALQLKLASLAAPATELRSVLLAAAGLYQITPAKAACLERCRSPLSVVLSRWPLSTAAALRIGFEHGLYCLACCWALMLLGLVAGTAGWLWMSLITLLVAAEKLVPAGPRIGRWAGLGLIGLAVLLAAGRL
jgi:predicted metal-binding membrane protein